MRLNAILIILLLAAGSLFMVSTPSRADWTYTVRRGDTLYSIARKTGVAFKDLQDRNGLRWNWVRIGQRIVIPTGVSAANTAPIRTSGDLNLLARIIHAEAGAEPYIGKVAVGGVIMNRIQSPKFPKTIAGVVYQPNAFESVSNGIVNLPPTNESIKAAADALGGWDPSGGALYFFNPAKTNNRWIWARRIINRIGKHVFSI